MSDQMILTADSGIGPVNINEISLLEKISIYFLDKVLFVDFKNANINTGLLSLFSMTGQEIKSIPVNSTKMEIELNGIKSGNYLLNIQSEEGIIAKDISIE